MIRLEEIVMIHDLKRQGLSVSAIARQTGLDRKTVRKHLAGGVKAPVYKPRPPRPRELEPYEPYASNLPGRFVTAQVLGDRLKNRIGRRPPYPAG